MSALLSRLFGRSPGVPDRPRLDDNTWHVPAETSPHKACWMAWPQKSIWGHTLLPLIEADIALIANTIAKYEQVVMCAGNAAAAERARILCYTNINIIDRDIAVDDCWMRDSGPIFRINSAKEHDAFGLNFNGWGNRQVHAKDKSVAQNIASYRELHFSKASVVSEGGAIEHDGDGTIIATESSIINNNRNRGKSKIQIETELLHLYGATKMIWVPGLRNQDRTDDHIDAVARFVKPGTVLEQLAPSSRTDIFANDAKQIHDILSAATDAKGRKLDVITLEGPDTLSNKPDDYLDSYINFFLANGALITARFGDEQKDAAAKQVLSSLFPDRIIEQLNVDNLHSWGGGIHCVTQQEPQ